jgi:hypothetical protein
LAATNSAVYVIRRTESGGADYRDASTIIGHCG